MQKIGPKNRISWRLKKQGTWRVMSILSYWFDWKYSTVISRFPIAFRAIATCSERVPSPLLTPSVRTDGIRHPIFVSRKPKTVRYWSGSDLWRVLSIIHRMTQRSRVRASPTLLSFQKITWISATSRPANRQNWDCLISKGNRSENPFFSISSVSISSFFKVLITKFDHNYYRQMQMALATWK